MKASTLIIILCSTLMLPLLNGCASLTCSETQTVAIQTLNTEGSIVDNCQCKLSNDRGKWQVSTPNTVLVHKSSKDLEIVCEKPGFKSRFIKSKSHPSPAMLANLILPGGTIGAIIDHKKGTAYIYPNTIRVIMEQKINKPSPLPITTSL